MLEVQDAAEIEMSLTERLAMMRAASVGGLYFSHPESAYFNVGKIGADQVADMVRRRGVAKEDVGRWRRIWDSVRKGGMDA